MKKIKILLIEDNRLLRDGIEAMIKKQPDMHMAAAVGDNENILPVMNKFKPDIVLLDLGLRNKSSLNIVKLSKQHYPETKIIVMDLVPLQADILEFVQIGVSGFITKDASINEFCKTIRSVYQGNQVLPSNLAGSLFSQIVDLTIEKTKPSEIAESICLTKRERQVIALIANGSTNKEISAELHLSIYTVKSHVHNILEKLALNTRMQIARHVYLSNTSAITTETAPVKEKKII